MALVDTGSAPTRADAGSSPALADASAPTPPERVPSVVPLAPPGSLAVGERPESAQFDPVTNAWYVSVQAKPDVPGDGYIVKLDADARTIVSERFVTGLNEPKGVSIFDGRLFVADVSELVTVDVATGAIASKTSIVSIDPNVPEAPFLNDVAVRASSGYVYVTDSRNDVLYRFQPDGTEPVLLLRDPSLEAPNGLLVDERDPDDPRLLIATLGPGLDPARGVTERLGAVLAISLADLSDDDGQVAVSYVSQRIGNLDGLALSGDDLLVTDIFAGRLLRVTPSLSTPPAFGEGDATVVRSGLARGAGFGLDPARGLVVVPETTSGLVTAITLD
jgi:DNA-binding beta-propeller fold protein YncE